MTVVGGFKRLGLAFAIVAIVGGGILATLNSLISTDTLRERVRSELQAITGFEPQFAGPVTVSLFPFGRVTFAGVRLGDGAVPPLEAERLTVHLKFLPLMLAQVVVGDLTLEQPHITVDLGANGRTNWPGLAATLDRGKPVAAKPVTRLSEIHISDGTLTVNDQVHHRTEQFDRIEVSFAWPTISKSFGATGQFRWRGEMLDASISLNDLQAALAGSKTGLKVRVAGAPLKAAFDGSISTQPTLKIEGTFATDTPNLRKALIWAGQKPLPGGGFAQFSLKGQANVVGGTIALSGVNLELDGNAAEGVLTFATDGRQTLQGTLAADSLDLTPYVATVRLLAQSQRAWNDTRISLDGLSGFDVDLRLSAGNVTASGAKFGRTAIGANLRGGNLNVTVGESQAFGGVIKGSFTLGNYETGIDLKSQMQFTGVDLAACLGQMFGLRRLEGKGNLAFAVEGLGNSVLGITQTLTGTINVASQSGSIVGLNVEQLLRRLERSPLSGGGDFRSGRTPFDKLSLVMSVLNGTATIQDATIASPLLRLALTGSAAIPARDLSLKGTAGLYGKDATTSAFELPFIVEGSWDDPVMLPDPQILIRRSGAAQPLLDAVRDRRAREAVQSAIQQLSGAPAVSAPAAAPAAATAPDTPAPAASAPAQPAQ